MKLGCISSTMQGQLSSRSKHTRRELCNKTLTVALPPRVISPEGKVVRHSLHGADLVPLKVADQTRVRGVASPAPEYVEGYAIRRLTPIGRIAHDSTESSEVEPEFPRMCLALVEKAHARSSPVIGREENGLVEVAEPGRVEIVRGKGVGHAPACFDHRQAFAAPTGRSPSKATTMAAPGLLPST
jgi:hypothetical protein